MRRDDSRALGGLAASLLCAPMHGAFYLEDDLLEDLQQGPEGLRERTARAREAFQKVRQRAGGRQLALLGGSEPDLNLSMNAPARRA